MSASNRRWWIGYAVFLGVAAVAYGIMIAAGLAEHAGVITAIFLLGYTAGRVTKIIENMARSTR